MSKFIIQGGRPLSGTIEVAGNKNAVLPIMAATILIPEEVTLTNVPRIRDVVSMAEILRSLGAQVEGVGTNTLVINTHDVHDHTVSRELTSKLRASVLLLGPLYARFGKATIAHPGGDIIGKRSIDTHLEGLSVLGARTETTRSGYHIEHAGTGMQKNISIFLTEPSVTGTENLLMASAIGEHVVHIENAACEPHIVDLSQFLNAAGAKIVGAGTHKITVTGVKKLSSIKHSIVPDYLEAGTFAVLSAITGGHVSIHFPVKDDFDSPLHILSSMGIEIEREGDMLLVKKADLHAPGKRIQAAPHPGFPTDLMSPFIVLATQAKGETLFHDPLNESRMFFVDKLINMGAHITICDPHRVIVYGPTRLYGSYQSSPDIRAGIALVIAALVAEGESIIDHAEIIERGYEKIAERLHALGAAIEKVD